MSFCAKCGRRRDGDARYCGGCGAEFSDSADEQEAAPAGATRTDLPADVTRTDAPDAAPDPFASWYQPQTPRVPPGGLPDGAGEQWQPTQTVQASSAQPVGYPSAPPAPPPPPQMGPQYSGPHRGGQRGLFTAVAVVVVLAAGGGAYALASSLGKHPAGQPQDQPSGSAPASTGTAAAASSPAAPSSAGGTPAAPPALSLVAIAPGVSAGSAQAQVETLLSHYFDGINRHDYQEYASTLNAVQRARQPQSTFNSGFGTTTDSKMTLTSLTSSGSGLTATVTFTSHQAAAQSVDNSSCNVWTLNLYLVPQGSGYLIGPAPAGYRPNYADC